jgi:hypothetical protein
MRKPLTLLFAALLAGAVSIQAQEATIAPPENIVADGLPKIPASMVETVGRYA